MGEPDSLSRRIQHFAYDEEVRILSHDPWAGPVRTLVITGAQHRTIMNEVSAIEMPAPGQWRQWSIAVVPDNLAAWELSPGDLDCRGVQ